jgi:uncharacterized protein
LASGLIALLDDIAAIAKVAAASLDDAAAQAAKAGSKAAGIVIDDAAVTPRYVVGFAAERELPIIWKIAKGSIKNKLLFLTPAALLLSAFAPWLIAPLLLIGGAFLCMEGFHKVMDLVAPHEAHGDALDDPDAPQTPEALEDAKVTSAIRTDFILSAEIMAITLATITTGDNPAPIWLQAAILVVVGVLMTAAVYGAVGIIVKADDVGAAMARKTNALVAGVGRAIVAGMPGFLKALSLVGMVAMLWVGGSIVLHELYVIGKAIGVPALGVPEHIIKGWSEGAASAVPAIGGFAGWLVKAAVDAVVGLAIGASVDPVARKVIAPAIAGVQGLFQKKPA